MYGHDNYNLTYQPELDPAQQAKVFEFMARPALPRVPLSTYLYGRK